MALMTQRFIDHIVILTGAGISAESGIATFRDADGLWENHDPMTIATPEAFARDPELVYRFYNERLSKLPQAPPNPAHEALAQLQQDFPGRITLVTQNVDDLHERGGSGQVLHMHGTLADRLCQHCGHRAPAAAPYDGETPCDACGRTGGLRPDVVWFGEIPYFMDVIEAALADCDLFIAIGTSGAVYPAAGFVQVARRSGAHTLEQNLDASDVSGYFHEHRVGPAGQEVPRLVKELLALRP